MEKKDYYILVKYRGNRGVILKGKNYDSAKLNFIKRKIYKRFYGDYLSVKKGVKGIDYPLYFVLFYNFRSKFPAFKVYKYDLKRKVFVPKGYERIDDKEYEKLVNYFEKNKKGEL